MQTKTTHLNIHILRIIACVMVILIHISATPITTLTPFTPPYFLFLILGRISHACVPLFLSISGFLLWKRYGESERPLKVRTFARHRLWKLVRPYLAWSFVYYGIYAIKGVYPLSLSFILKGLLLGTFSYHLYFMIIIFQCYLVYPLVDPLVKRFGIYAVLAASIALQIYAAQCPFPYSDRALPTYLGYFVAGMLMARVVRPQTLYKKALAMNGIGFIGASGIYIGVLLATQRGIQVPRWLLLHAYMIFAYASIFTLFRLCTALSQLPAASSHRGFIERLSAATQPVYYAHPLVLTAVLSACTHLGIHSISLRAFLGLLAILAVLFPVAYRLRGAKRTSIESSNVRH